METHTPEKPASAMRGTKVRAMSVVTNSSPSRSLALAVTSPAAFTMTSQPASFS